MFDRIDAAIYHPIRGAVYFFRGREYLKYIPSVGVQASGGSKIRQIGVDGWHSLPEEFRSDIDAAFWYSDEHIYFFKGSRYVKYKPSEGVVPTNSGDVLRQIGVTGWTSFPDKFRSDIDAAIYDPHNQHAYFFKGDAYIKYKPGVGVVKHDGQEIRRLGVTGWQSLPESFKQQIDAALYYPPNKDLYFFKEREYDRHNPKIDADDRYPRRLGLRHRNHGGWPGLSTLLGGPFIGNLTSDSVTIWMWLSGGKTTKDLIIRLDGIDIPAPDFLTPDLGTAAADVLKGVDKVDDGSRIVLLRMSNLASNSTHRVDLCRTDDGSVIESIKFKTAPNQKTPSHIRIGLGSCANSTVKASVKTFDAIADKHLDLLILCGDNCYYYANNLKHTNRFKDDDEKIPQEGDWSSVDGMLKRQLEARNHPQFVPIARTLPVFSTWDDHDFGYNNCDGEKDVPDNWWVGRDCAAGVYRLMWNHPYRSDGNHIHYDFRWGPLHFFMTDGRYYSKRPEWILGGQQCKDLIADLKKSDAPVKVVVTSSQLIPRGSKEGFAEAAQDEREKLLSAILTEVPQPVLVFSGDIHRSECQRYPIGSDRPQIVEVTSSPLRVDEKKKIPEPDQNRLWHTVEESFTVIDIDVTKVTGLIVQGSVTIEAYDDTGEPLKDIERRDRPSRICRTVWDLATRELA